MRHSSHVAKPVGGSSIGSVPAVAFLALGSPTVRNSVGCLMVLRLERMGRRGPDDIDLAVWQRDEEAIHRALTDSGWRHAPFDDVVAGARYLWNGVLLELAFLVADEAA